MKSRCCALAIASLLALTCLTAAQSTPPPNSANTTSACAPSTLVNGCYGYFNGLTDHASQGSNFVPPGPPTTPPASNTDTVTTVPAAFNVSWVPFNALLYPNYSGAISTQIDCHFQGWFGSGSNSAGTSHIAIGMDQSQSAVVTAQINNAIARGCNIVDFDWYGPSNTFINEVTAAWLTQLDNMCSANGGVCPLHMALMEDAGTPSGATLTGFETDIQYAYTHYMTYPAYWKMNVGGCTNRPVMLSFGWGSGFNWQGLQEYDQGLANCNNQPLMVPDGTYGLSNAYTDGAYNWIGVDPYCNTAESFMDCPGPGTVTTPGITGTVQFDTNFTDYDGWYYAAAHSSKPVQIGSLNAGFNDTNASWGFEEEDCSTTQSNGNCHPYGRKKSRQCGLVWVNSYAQLAGSNPPGGGPYFSSSNQIPFMGIPTWNDYEEGSAIEPGIDNCLTESSLAASLNGSTIDWSFSFGTTSYADVAGSAITIHHYALWDGTNGTWTQISQNNVGMSGTSCSGTQSVSCSAPLSGYTWSAGVHSLYVQAVGEPGIANHLSPAVQFNAEPVASISPTSITFPTTSVGTSSSETVTVSNTGNAALVIPQNGATVTTGSGIFNPNPNPFPGCTVQPNGPACTITVTFTPTACTTYTGTLSITDNASGSPQQVSLSGTGTGSSGCTAPPSSITPASYNFGNVSAGTQSSTVNFTFLNETGSTFTPALAAPNGFGIVSNTCSNVSNGSTCNIGVVCSPATAGSYNGSLTASSSGTVIASSQLSCTGTTVNQGTVLYSQIQNTSSWSFCTDGSGNCGGGNGTATASWTPNLSSPSEPNVLDPSETADSADFALGGTGSYSNARFYIQLPSQDSVTQFTYNADVYIDNPSGPQAIVFSLGQAVNNVYYPFQFQCDFKGTKLWNVYNPGNNSWNSTGVTCSAFTADTWTHLSFSFNTNNGKLNYTSFSVGGTPHSLSLPAYSPTTYSPEAIVAQIYLDGDASQDAFNLYLDNVVLYNAASPQPSASLSPSTLDLGTTTNGSATATRDLTLTNSGTGALTISSISVNSSQFTIESNNCGSSLGPNSSCSIGLSFTPTSGSYGTASGLVTVTGGQTVTANVVGTNLNPDNILYSNIQNDSTWTVCNTKACAGGNGSATSTYAADQTSPTINGQDSGLAQFSATTGSTYSNSKFQDKKAAQDSYSEFQVNMDVYVSDPTKPQNLQFGMAQADGGKYYAFQLMCDLLSAGIWRIWNLGQSTWVATSIPCTSSSFATADWTHISLTVERTSGNQMQYLNLAVGSTTYTINSSLYNPSSESPDDIEALFFESGNGSDQGYNVYFDNLTISHE